MQSRKERKKEERKEGFWNSINTVLSGTNTLTNKTSEGMNKGVQKYFDRINPDVIKCPKCSSTNISFIQNKRKSFSTGKAIVGGVIAGQYGAVAGLVGKKGKKNEYHCIDCGRKFKK